MNVGNSDRAICCVFRMHFWQFWYSLVWVSIKDARQVGKPFFGPTSGLWLSAVVGPADVSIILDTVHSHRDGCVSFRLKRLHARGEKNRQSDVVILTTMGVGRLMAVWSKTASLSWVASPHSPTWSGVIQFLYLDQNCTSDYNRVIYRKAQINSGSGSEAEQFRLD